MTKQIALLRAINVGGHRKIAMVDLRDWMGALGFADTRSILQTGNLIFSCKSPADNPLPVEAERDPSRLIVLFLKKAPSAGGVAALQRAIRGLEIVRCVGKQLYGFYPDGVGQSRLTSSLVERKLGTPGTGRNWNTVLKIGKLATG
jgi:uncharacterized protein (DUF1697 family)